MEFEVMTVVGFNVETLVEAGVGGINDYIDNVYYDEYRMLNSEQRKNLWKAIAKKLLEKVEKEEVYFGD